MQRELRSATIYQHDDQHVVGSWKNLLFTIFRGRTTLAAIHNSRQARDQLAAFHRAGISMLVVVESHSAMPTADVRKALQEALEGGAGTTLLSAVVHEGTGFQASAIRSVVTGLNMLTRLPYPHRIFATVGDAAVWIGGNSACGLDPLRVVQIIHEVRRRTFGRDESVSQT